MNKRDLRRKATPSRLKTYKDYLDERKNLLRKGYELKDKMSKREFNYYYERLRTAKREGEIKSQPWQTLISKEKLLTRNQARVFAKATEEMTGKKTTQKAMYKLNKKEISEVGEYIAATKATGLYGGQYE